MLGTNCGKNLLNRTRRPLSLLAASAAVGITAMLLLLAGNQKVLGAQEKKTNAMFSKEGQQVWALTSIILDDAAEEIAEAGKTDSFFYSRNYEDGILTYAFEDRETQYSGTFTATVPKNILMMDEIQQIELRCVAYEGADRSRAAVSTYGIEVYYDNFGWDGERAVRGEAGRSSTYEVKMNHVFKQNTEKGFVLSLAYFGRESEWKTFIGCALVYTLMDAAEAEKEARSLEDVLAELPYNTELAQSGVPVEEAEAKPEEAGVQQEIQFYDVEGIEGIVDIEDEPEAEPEPAPVEAASIEVEQPEPEPAPVGAEQAEPEPAPVGAEQAEPEPGAAPVGAEPATGQTSTNERPAWEEFTWYEEVHTQGFWDGAKPLNSTEKIVGGWKGYVVFEKRSEMDSDIKYLFNADLAVEGAEGTIVVDWYLISIDGEIYDNSGDRDSAFVGDYANQEFYVVGPGNISLGFFYEYQGKQYAMGRMMMPSGEEGYFCLMRP